MEQAGCSTATGEQSYSPPELHVMRLLICAMRAAARAAGGVAGGGAGGARGARGKALEGAACRVIARQTRQDDAFVHGLWCGLRTSSLRKLRAHLARGDRTAGDEQLTALVWAVIDLLLLYDTPLLSVANFHQRAQLAALERTFELVQRFQLEPEHGGAVSAARWSHAARHYCRNGVQLSAVALQRRWHELKLDARRRVCAPAVAGNPRPLVLPIHQAVVNRYPHVVESSELLTWRELVAAGRVAEPTSERGPAPGETRMRRPAPSAHSRGPTKSIETINLSDDEASQGNAQGVAQNSSSEDTSVITVPDVELGSNNSKKERPHCKSSKNIRLNKNNSRNNDLHKSMNIIVKPEIIEIDDDAPSPKENVVEAIQEIDFNNVDATLIYESEEEDVKTIFDFQIGIVDKDANTTTVVSEHTGNFNMHSGEIVNNSLIRKVVNIGCNNEVSSCRNLEKNSHENTTWLEGHEVQNHVKIETESELDEIDVKPVREINSENVNDSILRHNLDDLKLADQLKREILTKAESNVNDNISNVQLGQSKDNSLSIVNLCDKDDIKLERSDNGGECYERDINADNTSKIDGVCGTYKEETNFNNESNIDPKLLMWPVILLRRIDDPRRDKPPIRRTSSSQKHTSLRSYSKLFYEKNKALLRQCKPYVVPVRRVDEEWGRNVGGEQSGAKKRVQLPDMEKLKRNNRGILMAEVAPLVPIGNATNTNKRFRPNPPDNQYAASPSSEPTRLLNPLRPTALPPWTRNLGPPTIPLSTSTNQNPPIIDPALQKNCFVIPPDQFNLMQLQSRTLVQNDQDSPQSDQPLPNLNLPLHNSITNRVVQTQNTPNWSNGLQQQNSTQNVFTHTCPPWSQTQEATANIARNISTQNITPQNIPIQNWTPIIMTGIQHTNFQRIPCITIDATLNAQGLADLQRNNTNTQTDILQAGQIINPQLNPFLASQAPCVNTPNPMLINPQLPQAMLLNPIGNQAMLCSSFQPPQMQTLRPPQMQMLQPPQMQTLNPPQMQTLQPRQMQTLQPSQMQTLQPSQMQTLQPAPIEASTNNRGTPMVVAGPKTDVKTTSGGQTGLKRDEPANFLQAAPIENLFKPIPSNVSTKISYKSSEFLDWSQPPMSYDEVLAQIPAIHHVLCTGLQRLHPWRLKGRLLVSENQRPPAKAAIWTLRPRVRLKLPDEGSKDTNASSNICFQGRIYQKLSDQSFTYALMLTAVESPAACARLLSRGATLQLYCLRTCSLLPIGTQQLKSGSVVLTGGADTEASLAELTLQLHRRLRPLAPKPLGPKPSTSEPLEPKPSVLESISSASESEPKASASEPLESKPSVLEPLEPEPFVLEPLEPVSSASESEPKSSVLEPLEPISSASESEPKPSVSEPLEPISSASESVPKPSASEPLEPKPSVLEPLEPISSVSESLEPKLSVSEPLEPKPSVSEPLEPKPSVLKPLEPISSESESEPKLSALEPLEPKPSMLEPMKLKPSASEPLELKSFASEPLEPIPFTSEPLESNPSVSEPLESIPSASESLEVKPSVTEPLEPKPSVLEPLEPIPFTSEPLELKSFASEPLESKPSASEPLEPKPSASESLELKTYASEPLEPNPSASESSASQLLEPKPSALEPLEPKPSALEPLEPTPSVSEPFKPKLSASEPLKPKPSALEPLEPKPSVSEPSVSKLLEPKPSALEPLEPKPSALEPLEPTPSVSEPLKPKLSASEPLEPKPSAPKPCAPKPTEPISLAKWLPACSRESTASAAPMLSALISADWRPPVPIPSQTFEPVASGSIRPRTPITSTLQSASEKPPASTLVPVPSASSVPSASVATPTLEPVPSTSVPLAPTLKTLLSAPRRPITRALSEGVEGDRHTHQDYAVLSEEDFVAKYRLPKTCVRALGEELKPYIMQYHLNKVLACLRYLCTDSERHQASTGVLQVLYAFNRNAILDKYISLNKYISSMHQAQRDTAMRRFMELYKLPNVLGVIDGMQVPLGDLPAAADVFLNPAGFHSLNLQLVCDADLNILSADCSRGGSVHDCKIWAASALHRKLQQLQSLGETVWLLGDTGFLQRETLMTPISPPSNPPESHYNTLHSHAWASIRHCINSLRARWRRLTTKLPKKKARQIINACVVLHNIAEKVKAPVPKDKDFEVKQKIIDDLLEEQQERAVVSLVTAPDRARLLREWRKGVLARKLLVRQLEQSMSRDELEET